jgi:DNA-binding CsgD family transcriptional regulator
MISGDEQWLALADAFYDAAVDNKLWYSALEALANATGSRSGELISIGDDATVPLNLLTNVDPAMAAAFEACGGGDPAINPRVRAGMAAPLLQTRAENDFLQPHEHARHPHYREFAIPWNIPYICLSPLERRGNLLIGLAVLRSEEEGHISAEQREVFASLAPHVRAAVRMQIALEGHGAALVAGALEAVNIPAFVCDRKGRVQGLTEQGQVIVRGRGGLELRNQRLRAARDAEDKALSEAIEAACRGLQGPASPLARTVIVHGEPLPLVLDVMSLPSVALEFDARPRAVVIVRGSRGGEARKAALLQSVYGLTAAETSVALQVAQGKSAEAIAQERQVAVGTVRAQIKSLLAKLGVSRQVELVARLANF